MLGGPTWASLQSTTGWLVGSKRWCVAEQLVQACELRGAAGPSGGGCMQVYNTPETHVTRDYREGVARLGDLSFVAIDTSGVLPAQHTVLSSDRAPNLCNMPLAGRVPLSAGLPGLEPQSQESSIQARTASLTASVLQRSHAVLLVLDARAGVLPSDHGVVAWLRAHNPERVLLVANKAEGRGRSEAPGAPSSVCAWMPVCNLVCAWPVLSHCWWCRRRL